MFCIFIKETEKSTIVLILNFRCLITLVRFLNLPEIKSSSSSIKGHGIDFFGIFYKKKELWERLNSVSWVTATIFKFSNWIFLQIDLELLQIVHFVTHSTIVFLINHMSLCEAFSRARIKKSLKTFKLSESLFKFIKPASKFNTCFWPFRRCNKNLANKTISVYEILRRHVEERRGNPIHQLVTEVPFIVTWLFTKQVQSRELFIHCLTLMQILVVSRSTSGVHFTQFDQRENAGLNLAWCFL